MTNEDRNFRRWVDAPVGSYDDFEYAILTSYRAIGNRSRSLFSDFVPSAMENAVIHATARGAGTRGGISWPFVPATWRNVPPMSEWPNNLRNFVNDLRSMNTSDIDRQKLLTFIIGPLVLLLMFYLFYWNPLWSPCTVEKGRCVSFKELVEAFPSQPLHVWGALKAANALALMGKGPGIVTMVANSNNKHLLDELASMSGQMVAFSITPNCLVVKVNGTYLSRYTQPQTFIHSTLTRVSCLLLLCHHVELFTYFTLTLV